MESMTKTEKTKSKLTASPKGPPEIDWSKGLSSGLTLVNLACTGRPNVAFLPGHYYLFVGDSGSAKTWLMKQIMAELANNKNFNDYRIIDDNPERGSMMDHVKFFGSRMAERLEPPSKSGSSATTEEFYDNVDTNIDKGPCFYGLDSEDALTSEDEVAKAKKNKSAREKGGETKGSYGDGKAKKNSSGLRVAHNKLDKHGSILVIIKQTRDNIGWDAMFNPKTRSGGRALTFYAALELWFSVKQRLKKTVKGKVEVYGTILKVHIKKNRFAGRDRSVEIPFYPSTGLDETGSMINWLIERKHWTGNEETVIAPEFNFEGKKEKLVHLIEEAGKEKELRLLTAEVWNEIEDACEVNRKRRYQ